jgi:hypothetical protein
MAKKRVEKFREDVREGNETKVKTVFFDTERVNRSAVFRFSVPPEKPEIIHWLRELRRGGRLSTLINQLVSEHWRIQKARIEARQEAENGVNQ